MSHKSHFDFIVKVLEPGTLLDDTASFSLGSGAVVVDAVDVVVVSLSLTMSSLASGGGGQVSASMRASVSHPETI